MQRIWRTENLMSAMAAAVMCHTDLSEREIYERTELDEISAQMFAMLGEENACDTIILPLDYGFVPYIPSAPNLSMYGEAGKVYARLDFSDLTCTNPDEAESFIRNKYLTSGLSKKVGIGDDADVLCFEFESSCDTIQDLSSELNIWLLTIIDSAPFKKAITPILKYYK